MLKTTPLLLGAVLLCFAGTACEEKKTAAQLNAELDKMKKEERRKLAAKYYQELITKFPDSPRAEEAKQRLQALGPVGPPGAKTTPK